MVKRSKFEKDIINQIRNRGYKVVHSYRLKGKIYDIYIPKLNTLIECNGDYWHANPKKYKADYYNTRKRMTAKEIWEQDAIKLNIAIDNGFNYFVIWEYEYKRDKTITFKKLKENGRKSVRKNRKRNING